MARPRPRPRTPRKTRPTTWPAAVDAFMDWLGSRERSPYTARNYRHALAEFALWWEDEGNPREVLTPVAITGEDLLAWKRSLRSETVDGDGHTLKPATVNLKLAAVKSFLGWCADKDVIAARPELPKQVAAEPRPVKALDEDEQRELLRAAKARRDKRTWPLVFVMIECGLRLAEWVELRRKDLDLRERTGSLTVRKGKGWKSRTLPLSNPEVRRALKALLGPGTDPEDPVLRSQRAHIDRRTGRPTMAMTARGVEEVLERLKATLGWSDLHPHMLRHTFGMNLRRAGSDWTEIAKLMGHGSIVTTMTHYGTPSEKDLARVMNRHGRTEDD